MDADIQIADVTQISIEVVKETTVMLEVSVSEQGLPGPKGDSAVALSSDPNNAARLGSDSKIFVPAVASVDLNALDLMLGQKFGDIVGLASAIVKPFPQPVTF